MTMLTRALTTLGTSVAALAVVATPATAAPAAGLPADADFAGMATGGYSVAAHCALGPGYSTDPRYITFVVQASAASAGPSLSAATSVQCTVYDTLDKSRTYGGASGAFPGPYVVAVGQATVPVGRVPAVCVTGGATYFDGTTIASAKTCP